MLAEAGGASWAGLRTCGSVWACPPCARKVWAGRADQLTRLLEQVGDIGLDAALVTLTMRHDRTQSLSELWDGLGGAWRATEHSRGVRAMRDELGVEGFVRRIEATHGHNGWHLHIHAIALLRRDPATTALDRLGDAMYRAWAAHLTRKGFAAPRRDIGVDVRLLDLSNPAAAVAGYITTRSTPEAMAAGELTDAMGGKRARGGNRTPWELLADAMDGDRGAARLWAEWEQASKGKRALTGLTQMAKRLGLDLDAELTDEELAAYNDGRWPITHLNAVEWARLLAREDGPADLLTIAERAARRKLWEDPAGAIGAAMCDVALTLEDWGIREPGRAPPTLQDI